MADGNDLGAIDIALIQAFADPLRPSLILVHTHIGYGSPEQDSYKAHGSPLGVDDVRKSKQTLGWPTEPAFMVPHDALARFRGSLARGAKAEAAWTDRFTRYANAFPEAASQLRASLAGELPDGWNAHIPLFPADAKGAATRDASGKVLNAIAPGLPALTGGSADLDPSTKTALKGFGDFNPRGEDW